MYELFLHIGLPKTGSTAIQLWLSRNRESLERSGIHYADIFQSSPFTSRIVGNGFGLFPYLLPSEAAEVVDDDEVEREFLDTYFGPLKKAFISAEILHNAEIEKLQRFSEFLARENCGARLIVFVRDVYSRCYSLYLQRLKGTSYHADFRHYAENVYVEDQYDVLARWQRYFPNLTIVNYDLNKSRIGRVVCDFIDIDGQSLDSPELEVANRTISPDEAMLLRGLNRLHGGQLSEQLSEAIMRAVPGPLRVHPVDPAVAGILRERFQRNVDKLNQTFLTADSGSWITVAREPDAEASDDEDVGSSATDGPNTEGFLAVAEVLIEHIRRLELQIKLMKANAALSAGAIDEAEAQFQDVLAEMSRPQPPGGIANAVIPPSNQRRSLERAKLALEMASSAWSVLDGSVTSPTE